MRLWKRLYGTLNREVTGLKLLAEAVVPLGKELYPHCLVPQKGLKAVGVPWLLGYKQLAFLVARGTKDSYQRHVSTK